MEYQEKCEQMLWDNKFTPVTYSNITFNNDTIIGACSVLRGDTHLYKAVAISMADNEVNPDNLEECVLDYETVKEIAYTTDILFTDYAIGVHSHSLKSKPFNTLKIVRI